MIRSMTGFGEAVVQAGGWSVRVRVRTLNHRGMRLNFHFPEEFSWRAPEMRGLVGQYLKRGTIDIWLGLTSEGEVEGVTVDDDAAKRYAEKLRELQLKLGLSGGIDVSMVVGLPGVVHGVELEATDELWELAGAAVREALAKAAEMRRVEGEALAEELLSVASRIEGLVVEAEGRTPEVVEAYKARLLARLRCLTEGEEERLSEQDIMREVVLFVDRADIAEELETTGRGGVAGSEGAEERVEDAGGDVDRAGEGRADSDGREAAEGGGADAGGGGSDAAEAGEPYRIPEPVLRNGIWRTE